ncbi:RING-H2 finger protein [Melia azedarach]|uniref:RING-H2 finger protein n=1 Tax=Melia azedarach TaxID=155640 RepID=A0ACC1XTH7_MELAZ|nr:RING-H2 finger protein [Melia azedarach]
MESVNLIPDHIGPSPSPNLCHKQVSVTLSLFIIIIGTVCGILFFLFRRFPKCFIIVVRSTSNRSPPHPEDDHQHDSEDDQEDKLAAIPVLTYAETTLPSGSPVSSERESCAVCLGEYADTDIVRVLPSCKHMFHKNCIDRWLTVRSSNCPFCRRQTVHQSNLELATTTGN